ncbi:MAG: hypothetical protein GX638_08390 [Crenarchaeota archaeon]|nr:hypothetical protein [Thermoproteota archaeon]
MIDDTHTWSDLTIQAIAEEGLNLAVNMFANVLHTFSTTETIPEFSLIITWTMFLITITATVTVANCEIKKSEKKEQLASTTVFS